MLGLTAVAPLAQAVPKIQQEAAYFQTMEEDVAWFEATEAQLPKSDTRTLFLRIYHAVTLEMPRMFEEKQFQHPEWVNALMLKYVSLYRNALECDLSKACPVSPAWQKAFSENGRGKISPAGQLLISISAHVNRDLPVALASLPETRFDDPTYKADFEQISLIFQRRMPDLIRLVQEYQTCRVNKVDAKIINTVIQHAIGITRDKSWNWGRTLSLTRTSSEESTVMTSIEHHAHNEDLSISLFSPGPALLICL